MMHLTNRMLRDKTRAPSGRRFNFGVVWGPIAGPNRLHCAGQFNAYRGAAAAIPRH